MALRIPPFPKLMEDIVSDFLIFHLVGMPRLFDEDQFVFLGVRHMVVQVA